MHRTYLKDDYICGGLTFYVYFLGLILLYYAADCLFIDLFKLLFSCVRQALIDEVYIQRGGISCNGATSSSLPCFWVAFTSIFVFVKS